MRHFLAASLLVSVVGVTGCEPKVAPKDDHNHSHSGHSHSDHSHEGHSHGDEKKESYATPAAELNAVLTKVIADSEAIAAAAAKGSPDDAHDQLHDIGHGLESLPGIAKKASVDADFQGSLETATKSLFEAMMEIDGSLHDSGKEFKYDDHKETVEKAIATLKDLLAKAPK